MDAERPATMRLAPAYTKGQSEVDLYLVTARARADDTVDDRLIVDDLARRNRCHMIAEAGIHEGAHLLLEHIALDVAALDRDRGRYLVAVLVVLVQHEIAGSTVPAAADRRLDLQTRVGAEEEGIAGGVHVHSPGGAVVDHDVALAADHGNGEIVVHGEAVRFLVLCRILAEVRELLGGYGERLGIADGVRSSRCRRRSRPQPCPFR